MARRPPPCAWRRRSRCRRAVPWSARWHRSIRPGCPPPTLCPGCRRSKGAALCWPPSRPRVSWPRRDPHPWSTPTRFAQTTSSRTKLHGVEPGIRGREGTVVRGPRQRAGGTAPTDAPTGPPCARRSAWQVTALADCVTASPQTAAPRLGVGRLAGCSADDPHRPDLPGCADVIRLRCPGCRRRRPGSLVDVMARRRRPVRAVRPQDTTEALRFVERCGAGPCERPWWHVDRRSDGRRDDRASARRSRPRGPPGHGTPRPCGPSPRRPTSVVSSRARMAVRGRVSLETMLGLSQQPGTLEGSGRHRRGCRARSPARVRIGDRRCTGSWSTPRAGSSTWAASGTRSATPSASSWHAATSPAGSPAAVPVPTAARSTTPSDGRTVAPPTSPIWAHCVPGTTT